jgi:hypothetical protein
MGAHAEWTGNLVADIDSMYQSRAEENKLREVQVSGILSDARDLVETLGHEHQKRKVHVSEMLSDARDLVEKLGPERQKRATELHLSLGEFGGDVREAAEMWHSRTDHPTKARSRPLEFAEPRGEGKKKKGKQG